MNWGLITNEWRLKLLALGLAILMLGAVAFSQNPPTTRTLSIPLQYTTPPNIILINPPAKVTVWYSGLADAIARVDASNLIASIDATRALPGSAVRLAVSASTTVSSVTVQQPSPIAVQVDTRQAVDLPVQVNAHAAAGWSIDPTKTLATCLGAANPSPCKLHFDGPVTWETNLKAVATLQGNAIGIQNTPNQPVQLLNGNGPLDLSVRTVPAVNVDVTSVDIHTEAAQGTTSVSVPLSVPDPQPPPSGYRITGLTYTPLVVTISGNPTALARVHSLTLPSVDLSQRTSNATFQIAIPYPEGVTGSAVTATVTFSISKNPQVSPSPGP